MAMQEPCNIEACQAAVNYVQESSSPGTLPSDRLQVKCGGCKALLPFRLRINHLTLCFLSHLQQPRFTSKGSANAVL